MAGVRSRSLPGARQTRRSRLAHHPLKVLDHTSAMLGCSLPTPWAPQVVPEEHGAPSVVIIVFQVSHHWSREMCDCFRQWSERIALVRRLLQRSQNELPTDGSSTSRHRHYFVVVIRLMPSPNYALLTICINRDI